MDKNLIKKIIIEQQERIPKLSVKKREISIDPAANYIFTGQRRAGKTYLMYYLIQQKLNGGFPPENILFINFEDERLMELGLQELDLILECYFELNSAQPLMFFDEIQLINGWQKFARRLADSGFQVVVTGSNAAMVSNEMATTLGGRFMIREINPLSFGEFLDFKGLVRQKNMLQSSRRFEIFRLFEEYFQYGGFPETINFENKKEYLSNLFQKVFLGDIISRYNIRNPFALKILLKKLAESATDETSFNRIKNIIHSTGVQVGIVTLIDYLSYLNDAFLLRGISNFNAKITERETKKKYYYRDHGLLNLFLTGGESASLETLVFNKLYSMHPGEVFYLRDKDEVDFYIPEKYLVQVSYSLQNTMTREREFSYLKKIMKTSKTENTIILTYNDDEEQENTPDGQIMVIPAWKWLLNEY